MLWFIVMVAWPFLVVYAAIGDFMTMRIPNWLNLSIFLLFFPAALLAGMPLEQFLWHVAAFCFTLIIGFTLSMTIRFGGGDAKMMAALAIWFGWDLLPAFIAFSAIAGGLLAIAMKAWQMMRVEDTVWNGGRLSKVLFRDLDLPYGIAFASGALFVFPESWWASVLFT